MFLSPTRSLLYVTDLVGTHANTRLEHLSCFYGGLLALGVETLAGTGDLSAEDSELHRWAAEGLTLTCSMMYLESPTGLGPEEAQFVDSRVQAGGKKNRLWMDEVKAWKEGGKKGSDGKASLVPPGVRDVTEPLDKNSGSKEYYYTNAAYYSRPEVRSRLLSFPHSLLVFFSN